MNLKKWEDFESLCQNHFFCCHLEASSWRCTKEQSCKISIFQVKCAFERKELFINTWECLPNCIAEIQTKSVLHTCRMKSLIFFNSVKDLPLCRKPADVWVSFPSKAPPSPHSNAWTARPMLWEGRTNSAAWDLFWPWWLLWDFFLEASYSHCLSTCSFCFEGKRPDKDVRFPSNGC